MTFYLKPPDGIIPSHLFQQYAESRLQLLIAINKNRTKSIGDLLEESVQQIPRLDSLIEGTIKDRVSHFALRSCVIHDSTMHNLVIRGEQLLFRSRLRKSSGQDAERAVRHLLQHLRHYIPYLTIVLDSVESRKYSEHLQAASESLIHILKKGYLNCIPNYADRDRNKGTAETDNLTLCLHHGIDSVITVPFQQVLNLTSRLEVRLEKGQAHLQCHQIFQYLEDIFRKLLQVSCKTMRATDCIDRIILDPRLQESSNSLKRILQAQGYLLTLPVSQFSTQPFHLANLEEEALRFFPPCMSNSLKGLRTHHRLCHQPRVQLTLFLKSIGLRVDDCLRLLQEEYSKPACQGQAHKCAHSWQKDSSRYIYGTRHLYGLEGSRKNYSSHSCGSIQSNTNSTSCGGCPFVQDNSKRLKVLSEDLGEVLPTELVSKIKPEDNLSPIEACHKYLCFKVKVKTTEEETSEDGTSCKRKQITNIDKSHRLSMSNPIDFYRLLKEYS